MSRATKEPKKKASAKAPPEKPTRASAKTWSGGSVGSREIELAPYGDSRRKRLLKDVVVGYQANARQGTHKTKTRAETSYSEAKPWPQKHTGRARAGDKNSPLWRHGGTIHGPVPRDYRHHTPRGMLREALRSALYGKFLDGEVAFLDGLKLDEPSTKAAVKCLKDLGIENGATVVLAKGGETLYRSFRNIDRCEVVPASDVNALHVLRRKHLVFVGGALAEVEQRLARKSAAAAA
jgi:large subunit ribosomal protein L4